MLRILCSVHVSIQEIHSFIHCPSQSLMHPLFIEREDFLNCKTFFRARVLYYKTKTKAQTSTRRLLSSRDDANGVGNSRTDVTITSTLALITRVCKRCEPQGRLGGQAASQTSQLSATPRKCRRVSSCESAGPLRAPRAGLGQICPIFLTSERGQAQPGTRRQRAGHR